jgi:catechol 2,3-dioxygenase-like lactoylglutathione lyase family enzyme
VPTPRELATKQSSEGAADGQILRSNSGDRDPFRRPRNVERSRRFYTEVLGGETVLEGEPSIVALANGWIVINVGCGPTNDKPAVTLEAPSDQDRVSAFLNIRVADIHGMYEAWSGRGGVSDPPIDRGREVRCYIRDPDGHLIEVGQSTGVSRAGRRPSFHTSALLAARAMRASMRTS